jgi:hypothetical protein
MRPARGRTRRIGGARRQIAPSPIMEATSAVWDRLRARTAGRELRQSDHFLQTPSVFMTCMAMCGSWLKTVMRSITPRAGPMTDRPSCEGSAHSESIAAAPGAMIPGICDQLIGAGAASRTEARISGFGLRETFDLHGRE